MFSNQKGGRVMGALVMVIGLVLFVIATNTYGTYLERVWGIDENRVTPAHRLEDGRDYVPTDKMVVFGHHFASIAGAAPIVGAITASVYGWLPVVLWCIIGSIFVGGVQDFSTIFASVRHDASTIGEVVYKYTGMTAKRVFAIFGFLSAILLVSAFIDIVATTFVETPAAGTSSMLLIGLAILYGIVTNKFGVSTLVGSLIFVPLTFFSIYVGMLFPLVLSKTVWMFILIGYGMIAAVAPVWLLLQPRDYLNAYILAGMMVVAIIGILAYRPEINMPAYTSFVVDGQPLFPTLFVVFACGACSGVHSLVGSGTTSKQISNEKDIKFIGYFGMMLEGFLSLLAIITVMFLASDVRGDVMSHGAIYVFGNGLGTFMSAFGISKELGFMFANVAVAAFALTTMDSALRLARYILQELGAGEDTVWEAQEKGNILTNSYVASFFSLALGAGIAFMGYLKIWTLFGTANQMLTSMAFMGVILYLRSEGKKYIMTIIPMIWMMFVGTISCGFTIYWNIGTNWLVTGIATFLLIAIIVLYKEVYIALRSGSDDCIIEDHSI